MKTIFIISALPAGYIAPSATFEHVASATSVSEAIDTRRALNASGLWSYVDFCDVDDFNLAPATRVHLDRRNFNLSIGRHA
jgi:hypothetical protein